MVPRGELRDGAGPHHLRDRGGLCEILPGPGAASEAEVYRRLFRERWDIAHATECTDQAAIEQDCGATPGASLADVCRVVGHYCRGERRGYAAGEHFRHEDGAAVATGIHVP